MGAVELGLAQCADEQVEEGLGGGLEEEAVLKG